MKTVYGPVPSARFGRSLGVDPNCLRKRCSFGCLYCQLGPTTVKTLERKAYVDPQVVKRDLESARKDNADVITFSGTGEPTLNSKIGEMIISAKKFGLPIVVLTNSSTLSDPAVRAALCNADIVAAKLDASNEEVFQKVSRPIEGLKFGQIVDGIMEFRKEFKGKLVLQMMFVAENNGCAGEMARLAGRIGPDEVQLDTPLRKPSETPPLSREEMKAIRKEFGALPASISVISIYDLKEPEVQPIDLDETRMRRPGNRIL